MLPSLIYGKNSARIDQKHFSEEKEFLVLCMRSENIFNAFKVSKTKI